MSAASKRSRSMEEGDATAPPGSPHAELSPRSAGSGSVSAFRNVSACHRCRQRKNKCDHRLPACASCEKVNINCVGYDLTTKREVPRSYVFYLETRVSYLEKQLRDRNIRFEPPENLALSSSPGKYPEGTFTPLREAFKDSRLDDQPGGHSPIGNSDLPGDRPSSETIKKEREDMKKFEAQVNRVPGGGSSDKRLLGSTQGITFARVVIACLRDTKNGNGSKQSNGKDGPAPLKRSATAGLSMRDAFFGLHNKPSFRPATFPERELGLKLVKLYMEYANPQIPILHRDEFMALFDEVYAQPPAKHTPKQKYFLNIVFAIGSGIILGGSDMHNASREAQEQQEDAQGSENGEPQTKRQRTSLHQHQPEEYYASAMFFLEPLLSAERADESGDPFGGLEELQAVLLLAAYALLRPTTPGLWYIVGVGTRLAKDLSLHYEHEEPDLDRLTEVNASGQTIQRNARNPDQGRREYVRDMRRRLWWCAYSFDRLVSACVGRPLGISDDNVLAKFPSLVDDAYIKRTGIIHHPNEADMPSYKRVARHYFQLRILQAEVLDVLLQRNIIRLEADHPGIKNPHMHDRMKWRHLDDPAAFHQWRGQMDDRLKHWKDTAPSSTKETSVSFNPDFFTLNYWQVVMMLYRQNLNIPIEDAGDLESPDGDQHSNVPANDIFDPHDAIPIKIVEAARNILHLYRQLHKRKLVNWTYLATHAIFITAVSLLYAVWHSPAVRMTIPSKEMKSCVDDGIAVLDDLAEMCPPAADLKTRLATMHRAVHWQYAVWLRGEVNEHGSALEASDPTKHTGQHPTGAQLQQQHNSAQGNALTRLHPGFEGRLMGTADTSNSTTPGSSMFSPSSATTLSYQSVPSPNYNFVKSSRNSLDPYASPYQGASRPHTAIPHQQEQQNRGAQIQSHTDYVHRQSAEQQALVPPEIHQSFKHPHPQQQQQRQQEEHQQQNPFSAHPQHHRHNSHQQSQLQRSYLQQQQQPQQQTPSYQQVDFEFDPDMYSDLDLNLGLPYGNALLFSNYNDTSTMPRHLGNQNAQPIPVQSSHHIQRQQQEMQRQQRQQQHDGSTESYDSPATNYMMGNEHMSGYDMGGFIKFGHDMGAQGMPIGGQFFHPEMEGFFFGGNMANGNGNGNGASNEDGSGGHGDEYQGPY